jgi:DNA-binding FadR family transcriptional regulator
MAIGKKASRHKVERKISFGPLSRHNAIAALLGSEILSGSRKPGSRMPSTEQMAQDFGASRVLTREVTKTLAAKGMVASKTGTGTTVLDQSHWNWLDSDVLAWRVNLGLDYEFLVQITDIRRGIEPLAAALAAKHRKRRDIADLRAALKGMASAKGDHRRFAKADLAFHISVGAASHNPLFRSFTAVIETALSSLLSINFTANERTHLEATKRHADIVDAIEAGDEKAASRAMLRVIVEGFRHAKGNGPGAR